MDNKTEDLYQQRLARIKGAIAFEPIDRVPVIYQGPAFAPRYTGMTLGEFVNNPSAPQNTIIETMNRLGDFDGANAVMVMGKMSAGSMGLTRMKMPGRELSDDSLWQVVESEILTLEDYDTILEVGWKKFLSKAQWRVIDSKFNFYKNLLWVLMNTAKEEGKFRKNGYPIISGAAIMAMTPLEFLVGARSLPKFIMDLHRHPEKVKAVMDKMMPDIKVMMPGGKKTPALGVWIGGWRGAPSFLAPKLFDKFNWPYFVELVYFVIEQGLVPVLHLDQDWTREIPKLKELPAKKCLLNPDGMTDLRKFREIVGDRMAVMGDIPAAMLAIGTPEDVRNYVRDLIRDIGPEGLLISPGCDAPVNAKPENMKAYVDATHEFGQISGAG
jgi:hypothetical protein